MGELTLVARLALAVVFAAAGTGMLADRSGAQQMLGDFGFPDVLARLVARVLPVTELAVAVALIPGSTGRVGAAIGVVSAGSAESNRAKATEHGLRHLVVQERREVAAAYATTATPSAVLVAADGRVASPLVAGGDAIWKLLLRTPAGVHEGSDGGPRPLRQEIEITV